MIKKVTLVQGAHHTFEKNEGKWTNIALFIERLKEDGTSEIEELKLGEELMSLYETVRELIIHKSEVETTVTRDSL